MRWPRHGQGVLHPGQGLAETELAANPGDSRMQLLLLSLHTINSHKPSVRLEASLGRSAGLLMLHDLTLQMEGFCLLPLGT